uniref:Transmembrane BAX inhibitor motif-containing protein 4 n=1 Tax=Strigamia maritima TaxID=126957 RepID=T1IQ37_STRMM
MATNLVNMESASFQSLDDDFCYKNNVAQANVYVRMGFLRKVYSILSVQLVITTCTAFVLRFTPIVRKYVSENHWLVAAAMIMSLVLIMALYVKRKETPTNYLLLTAFTVVQAYSVGVIATYYDDVIVIQAFLLTAAVSITLTMYTLQSKRDFSKLGGSLFAGLCILIVGGLAQMFIGSTSFEMLLAGGGALLFSLFIVYDTHMIMQRLSPEEYILATIELYLDIINLFLELLRLLEAMRRN